jgi:hypothetical protein
MSEELALRIVDLWLATPFDGGGHVPKFGSSTRSGEYVGRAYSLPPTPCASSVELLQPTLRSLFLRISNTTWR